MQDAVRQEVAWLRSPEAVRQRCHALLELAEQDRLLHLTVDAARLDDTAAFVARVTRETYPDLAIPYHSRWRHFETGGVDRWAALEALLPADAGERARARIDLCMVSVLLDAGAGPAWSFREAETGQLHARSEGLAVASLVAFRAGLFSGDPDQPLRVDATGLSRLSAPALAEALQVTPDNPLVGLDGRAALLRDLGAALGRQPHLFGAEGRPGRLFDLWRAQAAQQRPSPQAALQLTPADLPGERQATQQQGVAARDMLVTLLQAFAAIWPERPTLDGETLGDVWPHPLLAGDTPGAALVPFHKLSQWLCYSLVEALERSAVPVQGLAALTGLAEYRNGGLFLDMGGLRLRDPALAAAPLPPGHPAVVEWRALTVALLDRLAPLVRIRLGRSEADLPLACVLQGGTWEAGRRIARERRTDGGPPLTVASDGSLF